MSNFFNFSFWFDVKPLPFMPAYYWLVLGICLSFFLLAIVSSILRWKYLKNNVYARNTWLKVGHWCYSFSLVGLFLFFFKQQMVMYLGMRIWLVIWLLAHLVWLGFVVKFILLEVPKAKKEAARKKEFQKYLP